MLIAIRHTVELPGNSSKVDHGIAGGELQLQKNRKKLGL